MHLSRFPKLNLEKIKKSQKTNAENPSSKDYEIRKIELKNISF